MPRDIGHDDGEQEEQARQNPRGATQEVAGTGGTEHGAGGSAAEGGAGVGTLALLQQDQGDEQRRDDDQGDGKEAIQHGDDSMGLSFGYREAAAQMAWNSAASSDAPPTNPPSMSGMRNSSAALEAFTLPPYKRRVAAAILAS